METKLQKTLMDALTDVQMIALEHSKYEKQQNITSCIFCFSMKTGARAKHQKSTDTFLNISEIEGLNF